MVEPISETGSKVTDYVNSHFYAEYLEGLKGKRLRVFLKILTVQNSFAFPPCRRFLTLSGRQTGICSGRWTI